MVFGIELNDEEQNLIAFMCGATLRACDRPGGYKEFQKLGFGKAHVIKMLQKLGHDTDKLAKEYAVNKAIKQAFDTCVCGHFANLHQQGGSCMVCICSKFWSPITK